VDLGPLGPHEPQACADREDGSQVLPVRLLECDLSEAVASAPLADGVKVNYPRTAPSSSSAPPCVTPMPPISIADDNSVCRALRRLIEAAGYKRRDLDLGLASFLHPSSGPPQ
jgi:hypothetical protein